MMGYALLVLGLVLWSGSHWWKRLAPGSRQAAGDPGKGIVSLLSVAGIVAMVLGGAVYLALVSLLKVEEARLIVDRFAARLHRRR